MTEITDNESDDQTTKVQSTSVIPQQSLSPSPSPSPSPLLVPVKTGPNVENRKTKAKMARKITPSSQMSGNVTGALVSEGTTVAPGTAVKVAKDAGVKNAKEVTNEEVGKTGRTGRTKGATGGITSSRVTFKTDNFSSRSGLLLNGTTVTMDKTTTKIDGLISDNKTAFTSQPTVATNRCQCHKHS